jgi:sRNA-binding protein
MDTYRFNREETEEVIRMLADKYPKCFFADPRQRRPLKKNLLADLQGDGFPAAYELLSAALEWYQSHFSYRYALEAGAKRVDLTGKEVSTVTEQEHLAAQKKNKDDHQKLVEKNALNSIKTNTSLYAAGRITDDQLRKVDAPPMSAAKPPKAAAPPVLDHPVRSSELAKLYAALDAADKVMTGDADPDLRIALGCAALGVVIKEAQRIIAATAGLVENG